MGDERYVLKYSDDPKRRAQAGASRRPPGTGKARVRLERKGRGGKTVTIVEGLALSADQMKTLLKELQQACGTGGTMKDNHLEIQGDFQVKIRALLSVKGYKI